MFCVFVLEALRRLSLRCSAVSALSVKKLRWYLFLKIHDFKKTKNERILKIRLHQESVQGRGGEGRRGVPCPSFRTPLSSTSLEWKNWQSLLKEKSLASCDFFHRGKVTPCDFNGSKSLSAVNNLFKWRFWSDIYEGFSSLIGTTRFFALLIERFKKRANRFCSHRRTFNISLCYKIAN